MQLKTNVLISLQGSVDDLCLRFLHKQKSRYFHDIAHTVILNIILSAPHKTNIVGTCQKYLKTGFY